MTDELSTRTGPTCDRDDAVAVVRRLREAGHVAYFAGGCVRDLLLRLTPKDYDVATDAPPTRVRELFPRTQAVGQAFGVILVRHRRSTVEVATFRSDGAYEDGRRPAAVTFTTAEEDAKRRDFTINGLFLDPLDGDRVIDHVGGQEDLKGRRLRAIGDPDERFREDHLRLLRALRFAARFGLEVEPATADAIRRRASLLKGISPERIADELRKMLLPPTRDRAWPMLWEYRLGPVVFRSLPGAADFAFDAARSIFLHFCPAEPIPAVTAPGQTGGFGVVLAPAVACVGWQACTDPPAYLSAAGAKNAARAMRYALKISNDESDALTETLAGAGLALGDPPLATTARKKRFLARPMSRWSRRLLDAVEAATGRFGDRITPLRRALAELEQTDYAPPPLVTGDDLTAAGLPPGPAFKRILDAAYDEQLEGRVTAKEAALEFAKQLSRESPGPQPRRGGRQ